MNYNPFLNLMGMRFGYDLTKYPNGMQDLIQKNLQDGVTSSNVQDNRESQRRSVSMSVSRRCHRQ